MNRITNAKQQKLKPFNCMQIDKLSKLDYWQTIRLKTGFGIQWPSIVDMS